MLKILNISLLFLTLFSCAEQRISFASHTSPPISTYLHDVLQTAFAPQNTIVYLHELPGRRVIEGVNNGTYVGDSGRVINFKSISNDDTSNYRLVNTPIMSTQLVMISLKSLPVSDTSWTGVNLGTVAFKSGSKRLRKNIKEKNRMPVSKNLSALRMVVAGRVRVAVVFKAIAQRLLAENPELNAKLIIHQKPVTAFNHYVFFNKDRSDLIPILEKQLKELSDKGVLQQLAKQYGVSPPLLLREKH